MKWSDEDIQYLIENFDKVSTKELENHIGRNYPTISWKARQLGLKRPRNWTDEERQLILDNIDKTYDELEQLMPMRNKGQIKAYCQGHKIQTASYVGKWTDEEKQVLIDGAYELSIKQIRKLLPHKSRDAIRGQIQNLGLSIKDDKFWSPFELDFLKDNLQDLGVYEIAKQLNRTCNGIIRKAEKLKLFDSAYILNEDNTVTVFDSFQEREVFLVLKRFLDIKKNKERFYYSERRCYIPDYKIITPEKIYLVEYFGGYTFPKNKKDEGVFAGYNNRTHRKVEYYKSLTDYGFIDLYPDDIKDDFKGVIDKIAFLL